MKPACIALVLLFGCIARQGVAQGARADHAVPVRIAVTAIVFGDTSVGRELATAAAVELRDHHLPSELTVVSERVLMQADMSGAWPQHWNSDDLAALIRITRVDILVEVNARRGRMGEIFAQPIVISPGGAVDTLPVLAAPDVPSAAIAVRTRIDESRQVIRLLRKR